MFLDSWSGILKEQTILSVTVGIRLPLRFNEKTSNNFSLKDERFSEFEKIHEIES